MSEHNDNLVTLAIHTFEKAQILKTRLESEGIETVINNVNLVQPNVSAGVRVRIKESDLPKALSIVEKMNLGSKEDYAQIDGAVQTAKRVILVPIDFSDYSIKACDTAFFMANRLGAEIVVMNAYFTPMYNNVPIFDVVTYKKAEDTAVKLLDKAKKIVFTPSKLYFYRINPQSILGQSFREKHFEMVEAFRSGFDFFNQKGDYEAASMFIPPLLMRSIYCWWGAKTILKNKKTATKILNDYRNNCRNLKYRKQITLLWYIIFKLISLCPWLYIWYRKFSPTYLGDRR